MTILEYIEALNRQFKTGISIEHSCRPLLQGLLEELLPGVEVTNEPQRNTSTASRNPPGNSTSAATNPCQFADINTQTIAYGMFIANSFFYKISVF